MKTDKLGFFAPTLVSCAKYSRCGQALCKSCNARKAFQRRCQLLEWSTNTLRAHPRARVQFITLTTQNVPLEYCAEAIRTLQASSAKFFSCLPTYGGYRQIELVPASKSPDGNPHIHALNIAPGKSAADTEQMHDLWHSALRQSKSEYCFSRSVDVQVVSQNDLPKTASYCTKPPQWQDITASQSFLTAWTAATAGKHLHSFY